MKNLFLAALLLVFVPNEPQDRSPGDSAADSVSMWTGIWNSTDSWYRSSDGEWLEDPGARGYVFEIRVAGLRGGIAELVMKVLSEDPPEDMATIEVDLSSPRRAKGRFLMEDPPTPVELSIAEDTSGALRLEAHLVVDSFDGYGDWHLVLARLPEAPVAGDVVTDLESAADSTQVDLPARDSPEPATDSAEGDVTTWESSEEAIASLREWLDEVEESPESGEPDPAAPDSAGWTTLADLAAEDGDPGTGPAAEPSPPEEGWGTGTGRLTPALGVALVVLIAGLGLWWSVLARRGHLVPVRVPTVDSATEGVRASEEHADRPSWSLIHRQSYDDLYDADNARYVVRDSAAGRAILERQGQEMERRGFSYDSYSDSYVQAGMEYDRYSDEYREDIAPAPESRVDEERGDASKPHIGAGWLYRGDFGTSGDYEVVYENLRDRLDHLERLEGDAREAHRNAAAEEKKAREGGDRWLEDKWRERRGEILREVRRVQEAKIDLTARVSERYQRESSHIEEQKAKWTADRVGAELRDVFVPDPKQLEPLFRRTLELRDRLQQSIDGQDELFRNVDSTIAEIRSAAGKAREAGVAGDTQAAEEQLRKAESGRQRLDCLSRQMQEIHRRSAQWQAGSHVLTATAQMTASQYVGQARLLHEVGKSAAQFLKPRMGVHRPSMIDEDGDVIGTDRSRSRPTGFVADGSAASPEDLSRRQSYEFYAVDQAGKLRSIKGAGNVDANPRKGELIVIRDRHTGRISSHRYYGEGIGEKTMHQGQKDLLWKRAQQAFRGKPPEAKPVGHDSAGAVPGGLAEDPAGPAQGMQTEPTDWGKRPARMPRNLRELRDMVDQDDLARLVKKDPSPGQEAAVRAEAKVEGTMPIDRSRDVPLSAAQWQARDARLGIQREVMARNLDELVGVRRNKVAEEIASRFPDFDRLDKKIREAYRDSGIVADDVVNPEPGERFLQLMEERNVRWEDFKRWQDAMNRGTWEPEFSRLGTTTRITPPSDGGGGLAEVTGATPRSSAGIPQGQPPHAEAPPPKAPSPPAPGSELFGRRPGSFAARTAAWDAAGIDAPPGE